ncbi:hypothetical protein Glove_31g30 [Diversispora epigaea]|uniref:Protein kinase domain-containing protein n=1 Tax=Diversispora epigaea TaxID=1348612 RepID=A0A397JLN6_9GLOM|nr:hypothetical protein Glove_31g30 [Diversispora epigaea]
MEAYEDLLADLNGLLNTNPKNVHALRQRGAIYCAIGNYKESLTDLNKSLKLETNNTFALRNRGKVFYKLGKYDEASADFNNSLEIESNNAFITNDKEIYSMIDKYEQAFSNYTKLLEIDPNDVFTLRNRGATCRVLGKCEEWLLYFKTPFDINPTYEDLLADLNGLLNTNPKNVHALRQRGAIYCAIGNYKESLTDLNKSLKLETNNTFALRNRGKVFYKLGKYDEASADFNNSLEIESNNAFITNDKEIYSMIDKYEQAFSNYTKLLEIDPNDVFTLRNRGATCRVLGKCEEWLLYFKTPFDINPSNKWELGDNGEIYLKNGKYYEALANLNKSLEIEPNNIDALKIRGETFYMMGKNDEALKDLNLILKIEPNNSFALRIRGTIYLFLAKDEESLADLNESLGISPNNVLALRNRGITYRRMYKYNESLADLNKLQEIEPNYIFTLLDQGQIYYRMDKTEKSLVNLNKFFKNCPNDFEALLWRGSVYDEMNKYDESIADYNKALEILNKLIEIDFNNAFVLYYRGEVYRLLEKYDKALEDTNKSLAINPNYIFALENRGEIYRNLKKYEEALEDVNKVLKKNPNRAWTLVTKGATYYSMEKYEEAFTFLEKSLEIHPYNLLGMDYFERNIDPSRMDLYNYHLNTDWNMDDNLYWDCDVEKCEYWDRDVEFSTSTEVTLGTEVCDECNQPCAQIRVISTKWCPPCNSSRFQNNFKNWTSNNTKIDDFIQKLQLAADRPYKVIEWIPFNRLRLVKYMTKGGFGSVFSAIWQDGQIRGWDINDQKWIRVGIQSVALKTINNPTDPISDLLKEIESNIQVVDDPHFIRCLDWNMDDNLYWDCDVEKCEYWDRDVEFSTSTEVTLGTEVCDECNQPCAQIRVISTKWCPPCNSSRFQNNFKNWTSNNTKIDDFIQKLQLAADRPYKVIEWIPFNRLRLVKYMTKGGFGSVFSAIWQDGQIRGWDINDQKWIRVGIQSVALKTINNPTDPISDLLKEIESNIQVVDDPHFIRCLGITQDSKTHNYMMVMEYATSGSLRAYMNANNMDVDEKGRQLWAISKGLYNLHEKNLIHQDFHPGNLLLINGFLSISDFGLCKQENQKSKTEKIFGVLPYIAPEVLSGEEYTMASDIYSFGIIAYELITGYPPYYKIPHNSDLALKICQGLRPKIPSEVSKIMTRLIEECWDADPKKRPTSKQLFTILNKWSMSSAFGKFILPTSTLPSYKLHPEAIYTSRLFNTTSSKPVNASNFMKMFSKSIKSTSEDLCKVSKSVRFSELLGRLNN